MSQVGPNIALLSVDALRADHCSHYEHERETTPTLDRLAAGGTWFPNAYSASPHTREAIPALLTGRYPDACIDDGYALAGDTIATLLAGSEYTTGAFHSNPYVSRGYGFARDFDAFDDDLHLGQHKLFALVQRAFDKLRRRHYAPATEMNERSLAWLEGVDEPFFLWNHYMDPHGPYDPPDEYAREFFGDTTSTKRAQKLYWRAAVTDPESITAAERQEMLDLYDGEIRYVDAQIGAFLDTLAERDLLEDTIVIVTADHGDAFGEHGYYGHPRQLDDELLEVPMVISGPDVPDTTVKAPVSTLDIVPSVLDAVGEASTELPGGSLLSDSLSSDRQVFSQVRGMKDESHLRRYCVRSAAGRGWIEREFKSGEVTAGPKGELDDVVLEHSVERLAAATSGEASEREIADGEVERRLEALGYK